MRLVFDHPGRQVISGISRWFARLAGSLLVCVGLIGAVIAVPTGLVLIADIVNGLQLEPENVFEPDFPLREAEAAFFPALLIAFVGLRYGRRLFRGRRSIVLFLRRFGYDGAMQVVTYAVAATVGVSWRLVTLDDDEIAPVGVGTASKVVFGAGEQVVRLAKFAFQTVMVLFPWSIYGMIAVLVLQVLVAWRDPARLFDDGTVDRYGAIFKSVMDGRIPVEYFELSLPGAFAVLATGLGLGLIALLISMVTLMVLLPLMPVVMLAVFSAEAVRKAEQDKTAVITQSGDIARMAAEFSRRGSQTFAPRLLVVRVATSIWQPTVTALASAASATIVDISEPSDNLAWELRELYRLDLEDRCIFIVDHARIVEQPTLGSEGGFQGPITRLIGDREVLAYTTDRAGMRRFARALHGRLLDLP